MDLDYKGSTAKVEMNVVMIEDNQIIEIQETAEGAPYTR